MKERINAIDYVKALACVLIMNSHMSKLYPSRLLILSFGGYFGNSLFLFVSGYCIANIKDTFFKWYWRRFVRVYTPYLCMLPLLFFAGQLEGVNLINIIMPFERYHFIPTILILYIPFYFISWLDIHTKWSYQKSLIVTLGITLLYFFLFFNYNDENVIGHFQFTEMCFYFIIMLLGALLKRGKGLRDIKVLAVIGILSFLIYIFQNVRSFSGAFVIMKPLCGIMFSYCLGCFVVGINDYLPAVKEIVFVSTVTLEAYLTHFICISGFKNIGFPTSIIYAFMSTFGVAYFLHRMSSIVIEKINSLSRRSTDQ